MQDRRLYDRIESYLEGRMPEPERAAFEEEVQADPGLAEEVRVHRAAHMAVMEGALLGVKGRLQRIAKERAAKPTPKLSVNGLGKAAFGLLVLGVLMLAFLFAWPEQEVAIDPPVKSRSLEATETPPLGATPHTDPPATQPEALSERPSQPMPSMPTASRRTAPNPVTDMQEPQATAREGEGSESIPAPAERTLEPSSSPPPSLSSARVAGTSIDDPEANLTSQKLSPAAARVVIEGSVEVGPACLGKSDGILSVDEASVSGGTPPYRFSVDGGRSFYAQHEFSGLPSGQYEVVAQDAHGNASALGTHEVPAERCEEERIVINTQAPNGNYWELPLRSGEGCRLEVLNETGRVVFSADEPMRWHGVGSSGETLASGVYAYRILCGGRLDSKGTIVISR